jgi:hypothetical protein
MDTRQLSGNIYVRLTARLYSDSYTSFKRFLIYMDPRQLFSYIYIIQANGTAMVRQLHKPQEILDLYGLETAVLLHVYNKG